LLHSRRAGDKIVGQIIKQADEERLEKATKRYEGQEKRGLSGTAVLSKNAWIACEIIKLGWRAQNSAIAQSWKDVEAAARDAVANPGTITNAIKAGFLWARLPSGRCLAYGAPRLKDQVWAKVRLDDGSWSDSEVMDREDAERKEVEGLVIIEGKTSAKVTVLGVNSVTKKWERSGLYGGQIAENNTQATVRDLLVNGMWKVEEAGYPIIATVYDEISCEVPRGFGDLKTFEKLICELPTWA
jgi:DNA polymerase